MLSKQERTKGSTLLIVVIIMSILFIMATIVFGYAVQNYRFGDESEKLVLTDIQLDTGLAEVLTTVVDLIKQEAPIEVTPVSRSWLFGDSALNYDAVIYEEGAYDPGDFIQTNKLKVYKFERIIEEPLPDPIPEVDVQNIAVEITSTNGEVRTVRKYIIHVQSTVAESYTVMVITAHD